jgi:hypothetical protein
MLMTLSENVLIMIWQHSVSLNTIKTLLNNNYNINKVIRHSIPQKQNTDIDSHLQEQNGQLFTYSGKETRKVAKICK